jgi:MFS family permease
MPKSSSFLVPLRQPVFRRIWVASLLSNFGLLIQGVGSAWAMTQLTSAPQMVALVQSAVMLPTMLFSLISGSLADMHDRRKVAMWALSLSLTGASLLLLVAYLHVLSPPVLLFFCFMIGSGQALFGPAWQSSVSELVPPDALATAVGLNSISYNLARSFGPAIGGVVVAIGGSKSAFAINALFYVPLLLVLCFWRRPRSVPRLRPERLVEAVSSGVRYVMHSPPILTVLARTFSVGAAGGVVLALMPLVAREILHGDARVYGLMLGMFGVGSVLGALGISAGHNRPTAESLVRTNTLVLSAAVIVIGLSRWLPLTGLALIIAGTSWLSLANVFNVSVQMSAPQWVAGRALSTYQAAISGGVAIGSWIWGLLAGHVGVSTTVLCAGVVLALLPLLARWLKMPSVNPEAREMPAVSDTPQVSLPLTERSGPIVVTVEYRVELHQALSFYVAIEQLQLSRRRNGAREWSISQDIDDPILWTERFQFSTWLEYLRHRDRPTLLEREQQREVTSFHRGGQSMRVRRMLARPLGSMPWKDDVTDIRAGHTVLPGIEKNHV